MLICEVINMLTDRELLIFQAILEDFTRTAEPIASQAISEKENINYSAATIRNIMAELEKFGFLEKTHTSSGRIPSERGYRYYVDHLVMPAQFRHVNIIKDIVKEDIIEFEKIIQLSAKVLSDLTNCTTIILGPEIFDTKLKQIQIVKLTHKTAIAILITDTGHVEHRSFTIPNGVKISDLEKLVNILNEKLTDVPFHKIQAKLSEEISTIIKKYIKNFDETIVLLQSIFFQEPPTNMYVDGMTNILTQPEFNDVNKIQSFYSLIENQEVILKLLQNTNKGINVSIGEENEHDMVKDLSLVTTSYELGEEQHGTIALIGPTRMEYKRVVNLLHSLSKEITYTFDEFYKE